MKFQSFQPTASLQRFVKEYWIINGEAAREVNEQKIVPDGFPELILHFGDPYEININGTWEVQDRCLIAGQIRNHFYLRNTGNTAMLGIKLQPATVRQLFGLDMSLLVDKVIPVPVEHRFAWEALINDPSNIDAPENMVAFIEEHLLALTASIDYLSDEEEALQAMVAGHGAVALNELQKDYHVSERQLERYFKTTVGLTPKFYSRILRFAHIFKLVENEVKDWSQITYHAGFYDQAHFIKNFKEFTGEEPSKYDFTKETMANFFLKP